MRWSSLLTCPIALLLASCTAPSPVVHSSAPLAAPQSLAVTRAPVAVSSESPRLAGPPETASGVLVTYAETARRIREASSSSDAAFQKLTTLCDQIGPRLSGSTALERAVVWAQGTFKEEGHEHVTTEAVRVPHWVRGPESATLLSPVVHPLAVLTLGGSVGTPPAGVTAELLVVSSFAELEAHAADVKGKIVLFDQPMAATGDPGTNYGAALPYRTTGASRASRFGALAVLVRSVTARSLGTPHTGSMRYTEPSARKIAAAAISVEDAELLHRLAKRGQPLTVHLTLLPRTLPDALSANVSAEIRGRSLPNEVVLIGAHLDSWDVGQGAEDDGAGVVTVMQALTTLRALGLRPRRTVRAVLFTNEENGTRGAAQYAQNHGAERHAAAFEMDTGAGAPLGFTTDGEQPFIAGAREIAALLAPIGANSVTPGFPGEDVLALKPGHVPLFGVRLNIEHYFDVHHSAADTLDKVDPEQLKKSVAALATMAFVVADREGSWNEPAEASASPQPAASAPRPGKNTDLQ